MAFRAVRCAAALLGAGLLLSPVACSNASETSMPTTTTRASTSSAPVTMFALPGSLAADFTALRPSLDGHAGMAIMAVGGQRTAQMGDWTTGPSWSTMKVPLTLAVLRTNGNTSTYQMSAAITESDNSAADGLWQALGAPDAAAKAVQAVLREGGDTTTTVPATRSRAEYSAFGQADWSLADQVRWASRLPCLPDADTVTTLMGKVVWGQQWGLGHLDNTRFKGGWGPDPSGNYLVRQFGLLTTPNGDVAISLAAQATSGTFDDGTQILNKMAGLITQHLDDLPAGHCAPAQ
ncbi:MULTISPECIES: hypothetical protein [Nocardia]|uniref:hypothetical protein n=1 Tax=Nocardia TaxID=1817 RepID=UPI0007EBA51C|nr:MULTISPECIES: hypothetical protein [Nocardia]OBA53623.1 hypothetical protein A5789_23665 [Nocardia sp. 852002-51101_SCH5132738]OBB30027.1 hypothetical protein A5748_09030 [Nocardia sp. 852002-51244_SCH5132740]OBF74895.1 hypothetical protein A9X06_26225 [Mycobacterium sp. 852002-51759_SCH5129042]